MPNLNLLDLAKLNGSQDVIGLIEESLQAAPEMKVVPGRVIQGTSYRATVRTDLPTTGFRSVNQGIAASKSKFASKLSEMFIAGGQIVVDKALAAGYDGGEAELKAIEAQGVMESALRKIGSQFYYGISADAKGFPGLQATVDAAHTLDAGGTTASTGSSVYAVRFGPQGVQFVFGAGAPFALSPWIDGHGEDAAGNKFPAWIADLVCWVGLQTVNVNAVARLKDATADSGKGVTDAKIADLLSNYWKGPAPDALFMSRRSAYQLQTSRSVTIQSSRSDKADGTLMGFAPMPTESNGIPVVITDQLVNTEALS